MNTEPNLHGLLGWLVLASTLLACVGCGGVDDTPPGQFTIEGRQWSLVEDVPESVHTAMREAVSAQEGINESMRATEPRAVYSTEDQQKYRFYWTLVEGDVVNWFFVEVQGDGKLLRIGSGIPQAPPQ